MAYRKLHDLKKNPISIGTIPINNVVRISAVHNNPQYSTSNGINQARHAKMNDVTGTVTLVVTQDSNSLQLIGALVKQGVSFPITSVDKTTAPLFPAGFFADDCRLEQPPEYVREAEQQDIEFVFLSTALEINHAGAGDA